MPQLRQIKNKNGFTIVELVIVIVVIGILAAISVIGYGAWRQRIATDEVKSDLGHAISAMEDARNFSDTGYPLRIPSTFAASDGVTVAYIDGDSKGNCIQAVSQQYSAVTFYVDTRSGDDKTLQSGSCVMQTPSISLTAASSTSITVSLTTATNNATKYVLQRALNSSFTSSMSSSDVAGASAFPVTQTGLSANTTYYYRVAAVVSGIQSSWSTVRSVKTPVDGWNYTFNYTNVAYVHCSNATCGAYQITYGDTLPSTGVIAIGGSLTVPSSRGCSEGNCGQVDVTITATNGATVSSDGTTYGTSITQSFSALSAGISTFGPTFYFKPPASGASAAINLSYTNKSPASTVVYDQQLTSVTLTK